MRRREFITFAGAIAANLPLVVRAEQPELPVVGFVNGGSAEARFLSAFRKGLSEAGYVEDQNVRVEYHWLEGLYDKGKLQALMADLVHRQVAVIVTPGNSTIALAAKNETSTIPIVFGVPIDPVKAGLVASLDHPDANVTGNVYLPIDPTARQFALLHEILPKASRIGILIHPAPAGTTDFTMQAAQEAAEELRLELIPVRASNPPAIEGVFRALVDAHAEALLIQSDAYFSSRSTQIATLTMQERLPTICGARELVEAGVLMSYATDQADTFKQLGIYAGNLLKGKKPAELPVMRATKFELAINMRTAKSLGIDISPEVLSRAETVIE